MKLEQRLPMMGDDFMAALVERGVIPWTATRVTIDAQSREPLHVRVELYGDEAYGAISTLFAWHCDFCGRDVKKGDTCPSCGAQPVAR